MREERIRPSKPPQPCFWKEPQAVPVAGIPEGGLAIIGFDSSLCVTAPEDLPVGKDGELGGSNTDDPDHRPRLMSMLVSSFLTKKCLKSKE